MSNGSPPAELSRNRANSLDRLKSILHHPAQMAPEASKMEERP
jgi:hypothetical protein